MKPARNFHLASVSSPCMPTFTTITSDKYAVCLLVVTNGTDEQDIIGLQVGREHTQR